MERNKTKVESKKVEVKVEEYETYDDTNFINKMAKEGWEMTGIFQPFPGMIHYYFLREVPNEEQPNEFK